MNLFLFVTNNSGFRGKCFIFKIEGCKIGKDVCSRARDNWQQATGNNLATGNDWQLATGNNWQMAMATGPYKLTACVLPTH
jgi:hypothetical protein